MKVSILRYSEFVTVNCQFDKAASKIVHSDFLCKSADFAIVSPSNPCYGPHLLRAVQAYNSHHISLVLAIPVKGAIALEKKIVKVWMTMK